MAQIEMGAGNDHESERDRHALICHEGVEDHARHRQINDPAEHKQHPAQGMELERALPHAPAGGESDDGSEHKSGKVGIDLDDVDEAVELAVELPQERATQSPGRAHYQQRQHWQELQPARDKIDERRQHPTPVEIAQIPGRRA